MGIAPGHQNDNIGTMTAGITWRPEIGDPTLVGWLTVIAYVMAAWVCVRAGLRARQHTVVASPSECDPAWMWCGCATVLFCLGINKQLDVQTLLVEVGRQVAQATGWFEQRRLVQLVSALVLAALTGIMLLGVTWKQRRFFKRNPLLLPGIMLVAGYVLLRIATIDHVDKLAGLELEDQPWPAALELSGLLCMTIAGLQASDRRPKTQADYTAETSKHV
jgi:hypothetical protein